MVDGLVALMDAPDGSTGPVNLGNPVETPILEIANLIVSKTNSKSEIVFRPLPEDDPQQRQPDISLARSKLGWEPQVALDAGLDQAIGYFKDLLADSL